MILVFQSISTRFDIGEQAFTLLGVILTEEIIYSSLDLQTKRCLDAVDEII